MIKYLVQQIIDVKLEYSLVVAKRPDLKEALDQELTTRDRQDLII